MLFDLDGTLLDAVAAHHRVFARVLAAFAITFDDETFRRHYSPNWYAFYERMGLRRDDWPEADRLWLQFYAEEAPAARDGADEVLAAVRASGRRIGLVTAGDRSRVERDLTRSGWERLFEVVVCAGDVPERKPHPAPLLHGLDRLGVSPAEAVYVGDSVDDVQMGNAAGVITLALLGGFSPREALEREAPRGLLESLRELGGLL